MRIKDKFQIRKKKFIFNGKENCTPMFITAIFTITKLWKQPKCPSTVKWIKKVWCIYTMEP